jgi:hypothetical protein
MSPRIFGASSPLQGMQRFSQHGQQAFQSALLIVG